MWGMVEDLAEDIRRVAGELGRTPAELTRAAYREHTGRAGNGWGAAKALAVGDARPLDAVPEGHEIKGVSTLVGADGRTVAQWVRTRALREDAAALWERLHASAGAIPPVPPTDATTRALAAPEGRLAVVAVGDMHLGMRATAEHSGEDWDLSRGVRVHREAIDLVATTGAPAREALVIFLGDDLHVAGPSNATVKGTPQDTDGFWWQAMRAGLKLKAYMVSRMLHEHARVRVWSKIGNHGGPAELGLSLALRAWFREDPRVDVEFSPAAVSYLSWGRCLIGATHGDKLKRGKMLAAMTADQPKAWAASAGGVRRMFQGHVHHYSAHQEGAIRVESFPTLIPADAYHHDHGWRSERAMHRIVFDHDLGEVSRSITPVAALG